MQKKLKKRKLNRTKLIELAGRFNWETPMRHPIEICLTACERFEESRGKASARRLRKKTDEKSFGTFLSQGAVGGVFTYFLLLVFIILLYRDGYAPLGPLIALPFFLLFGSVFGAAAGLFVWLPGRLFKRRFSFVVRAAFATAGASLLTITFLYLMDSPNYEFALRWRLGFICGIGLAVGLATGSLIRPCRLIVFGAGGRKFGRNPGSWLATPFGFFLRAASVFGLFEALLAVAIWIADRSRSTPYAPPAHLTAIIIVVLYFAAGSYFSLRTPRRVFLPTIVLLLNLPLVGLIVYLRTVRPHADFILTYVLLGMIGLWVIYTLGRLMPPQSFQRIVINSRSEAVATKPVIVRRALPVRQSRRDLLTGWRQ